MLDANKISHLTPETVWALSEREWLTAAWHLAVDGIVSGKTEIVRIDEGIWFVRCNSMMSIGELFQNKEIVARVHQISSLRRLPRLIQIEPIAPNDFGMPFNMFRIIRQAPEALWRKFAWRMAVDPETADSTVLLSCEKGIWVVRCHSGHACEFLQHPERTLAILNWIGRLRALPEARKINIILGNMRKQASQNRESALNKGI
ncbi:MAG: hypothetical protein IJM59_06855 [Proteobacteria bacterium]|nr:hypothetical protein [Pseudomonadota bacterium]